jgi:hypothetical protein
LFDEVVDYDLELLKTCHTTPSTPAFHLGVRLCKQNTG